MKVVADITLALLSFIISVAAFWIALLTYRSEKKPILSFMLTAQESWVILNVKNSGKGVAEQLDIQYTFCDHSDSRAIPHLPPDVVYTLKLEPFSIFENLPISERMITFNYSYLDCYHKKTRRVGIPIQIIQ